MTVQARNARTHLIRLIHVARRDLDMADDTYRAVVAKCAAGKTSSADCTVPELERVVEHLKKAGFRIRKPNATPPAERRPLQTDPESKKLRAIWLLLHEIGATQSSTEASLAAYIQRMTGVDDLRFTRGDDKYRAIEGLKAWAARQLPAAIAARIARLIAAGVIPAGLDHPRIHQIVAPTLNARGFDALHRTWQWLDAAELGAAIPPAQSA